MSRLMQKLNRRVQVRKGIQTPTAAGGIDQTYEVKATVWASVRPMSQNFQQQSYVRGTQTQTDRPTHTFMMRKNTSLGIDFMGDNAVVDSSYFLFLETSDKDRGRLFRILNVTDHNEDGEYLVIFAREIEEEKGRSLYE